MEGVVEFVRMVFDVFRDPVDLDFALVDEDVGVGCGYDIDFTLLAFFGEDGAFAHTDADFKILGGDVGLHGAGVEAVALHHEVEIYVHTASFRLVLRVSPQLVDLFLFHLFAPLLALQTHLFDFINHAGFLHQLGQLVPLWLGTGRVVVELVAGGGRLDACVLLEPVLALQCRPECGQPLLLEVAHHVLRAHGIDLRLLALIVLLLDQAELLCAPDTPYLCSSPPGSSASFAFF